MKTNRKVIATHLCLAMIAIAAACSKSEQAQPQSRPTLPQTWYRLPEERVGGAVETPRETRPTEKMDATVQTAFRSHTNALSSLEIYPTPGLDENFEFMLQPSAYVPWHLDGMTADFSISAGGLFGPLMMKGTASVSGTWKLNSGKKSADEKKASSSSNVFNAINVRADMSAQDIAKMVEPAVRSAVATETVTDETAFRRNLVDQGLAFLSICRLLDRLPENPGWRADGYRLSLAFTLKGLVTPIGGTDTRLKIAFNWQRPKTNRASQTPLSKEENVLFQSLAAFTQNMGSLVPEVLKESSELAASGFALDEYRVGIGMSVGGDIGIAQGEVAAIGKVIFKAAPPSGVPVQKLAGDGTINLIARDLAPAQLKIANNAGSRVEFLDGGESGGNVVVAIEREKFKEGLKQAMSMGTYFAKTAGLADTGNWKLAEIATKFETSIGGNFKVATVTDRGQTELVFNRIKN